MAVLLLLVLTPGVRADLGDVDTALGEISFEEVQVSPDGSRLAFITRRNDFERDREAVALWRLDLSGSARPIRLAEGETFSVLRWSPDGRLLSFLSAAEGEAPQLFVLEPAAGKTPRRLTDPARFADGVALYDWLPDGSGLIFAASESPEEKTEDQRKRQDFYGDVRRLAGPPPKPSFYRLALADGRAQRLLASPFDEVLALEVSPDGWWLAAVGGDLTQTVASSEVFLLPLGPQAVRPQRTQNSIWEESLAWAGDDLFAWRIR